MSDRPSIHDGQGDAMPCTCPACASPFVTPRRRHLAALDPETGAVLALAGLIRKDAPRAGDDLDPIAAGRAS